MPLAAVTCQRCGQVFRRYPCHARRMKYCSRACFEAARWPHQQERRQAEELQRPERARTILDVDDAIAASLNRERRRFVPSFSLAEHERAYVAGLIDGEGCIRIARKKQHVGPNHSYNVTVIVAIVGRAALEHLVLLFGGVLTPKPATQPNCRNAWTWLANGDRARRVLVAIQPYVLVKDRQVGAAIAVLESTASNRRGRRLTKAIIDQRDTCVGICDRLNQRGREALRA